MDIEFERCGRHAALGVFSMLLKFDKDFTAQGSDVGFRKERPLALFQQEFATVKPEAILDPLIDFVKEAVISDSQSFKRAGAEIITALTPFLELHQPGSAHNAEHTISRGMPRLSCSPKVLSL